MVVAYERSAKIRIQLDTPPTTFVVEALEG